MASASRTVRDDNTANDPPIKPPPAKKKQPQPRQLQSCTKCRERKVRVRPASSFRHQDLLSDRRQCDRTKPCSACCARGHPRECQFTLTEGTDFGPIQQSHEVRRLRAENKRLKERLLQAKLPLNAGDVDDDAHHEEPASRSLRAVQKRFSSDDATDNIYFGSPGLASVLQDVCVPTQIRFLSTSSPAIQSQGS